MVVSQQPRRQKPNLHIERGGGYVKERNTGRETRRNREISLGGTKPGTLQRASEFRVVVHINPLLEIATGTKDRPQRILLKRLRT